MVPEVISNKSILAKEVVSNNTPQAAVTTYQPDQIGEIDLTIIQQEVIEFPSLQIPSDELEEMQEQSAKEAKEVFDKISALETKAPLIPDVPPGRAKRQPKTNDPEQEMHDPQLKAFYQAIKTEWAEWIDYKRREKKGTYKTAKTEAATISSLAKAVNFDTEAAKAAIEHSIAKTYTGIYADKSVKPVSQKAERYSLEDSPVAQTPEQMRGELSRFYNAHKDKDGIGLLKQAQNFAGTNYDGPRMKATVEKFCCHRIEKGLGSEPFSRQHAALCKWLLQERANEAAKTQGPRSDFNISPTRHTTPVVFADKQTKQ